MSVNACIDPQSVTAGLSSLYERQELTDVRIVCSDGQLSVHQVVLAAVSEHLRQLFIIQNKENKSLILWDESISDIKTIFDCLYFGHQSIASSRFARLSRISARLGINLRSSVSVALEDKGQSSEWQRALPPTPHPKTGRQSGVSSFDDEMIGQMPVTSEVLSANDSLPEDEIAVDLSVPKSSQMDNVSKIIDAVATNGPTESEAKRRRKQSSPKAVKKSVRFDETADSVLANSVLDSTLEDLTTGSEISKIIDQMSDTDSASEPTQTTVNDELSKVVPSATTSPIVSLKVIARPKVVGRPPKNAVNSQEIKKCFLCGVLCPNSKQFVIHLNKEHKSNDTFKCFCGKEKKYAKTFATHYIQCKQIVANGNN